MFYQYIFLGLLSISLISVQSKYLILLDNPIGAEHKIFDNKNIPLSGGIYFFLSILINSIFAEYQKQNFLLLIFIFFFLSLGIYSDLKNNFSPKIRLIFQTILIVMMIIFLDLKIYKTNIIFIDYFINNYFFNIIFTSFCILVLLNGSNFCDGINCNVTGYYLLVLIGIFISSLRVPNILTIEIIISIFFIFYIFNLFKRYFLGDNGVYVISTFMAVYIIKFINLNISVSPLIALNLLWYPAFENLFSIIRRIIARKNIQTADRYHLHTLIFRKMIKKNNVNISNSATGIFLNIFMSIGIFISMHFFYDSRILILILLTNIIIYLVAYFYFYRKNKDI